MVLFTESLEAIREFLDTGGMVLSAIAVMILVMWLMILERVFYFLSGHKAYKKQVINEWQARKDRASWNAEQVRQAKIGRVKMKLTQNLAMITTFVALCPLMGLLGTVTGMIEVFDVMAISGSGNARSMASGVSKATIPTMAGMVGALSGVFANSWLQRTSKREVELLEDKLELSISH
ncbi:MAG: MotA/TolQ/ExbB proton channel family protein [Gammaproteobacteria bacterium]|nr:MotA/TolQ/ExbB proton channel family protein [Gammaproteobacteria bacterium]